MPEGSTGGAQTPAGASASGGDSTVSGLTGTSGAGGGGGTTGGRGGGGRGGRRGRRYRGRGGRGGDNATGSARGNNGPARSTFRGNQEGLEEHVCDLISPSDSVDRYHATTERLAEYIGTEWTGAALIKEEILLLEKQQYKEPEEPDSSLSAWKTKMREAEYMEWMKDERKLEKFRGQAIGLIWGQCAESVRSKIKGLQEYKDALTKNNLIKILELIEDVMYNFQTNKKLSLRVLEGKFMLMGFKQKNRVRRLPLPQCYQKFQRYWKAHKRNGGGFGYEKGLVHEIIRKKFAITTSVEDAIEAKTLTREQVEEAVDAAEQQMLAILFLHNADQDYYGEVLKGLQNEFSPTIDNYPETLDAAYQRLVTFTPLHPVRPQQPRQPAPANNNDGGSAGREVAFAQTDGDSTSTVAPGTVPRSPSL